MSNFSLRDWAGKVICVGEGRAKKSISSRDFLPFPVRSVHPEKMDGRAKEKEGQVQNMFKDLWQ